MAIKDITRSLFVFHAALSPCNNCDIEILDALTPRYDLERFGIQLVGSVRHADVLLVTGIPNRKSIERFLRIYSQAPKPCLVVAVGTCPAGLGIFHDSYNVEKPFDQYVKVDAYIPGCPPKPEAIIAGIVKLIKVLRGEK